MDHLLHNFVPTKINSMKNTLNIKETAVTPNVYFDSLNNCLKVEGRSIPMNAEKFWSPVLSWYIRNSVIHNEMSLSFHFDYLNSGSQQFILKLLKMVSESNSKGLVNVGQITWKFEDYDDDMFEMGQDFEFVSGLQFTFEKIMTEILHAA